MSKKQLRLPLSYKPSKKVSEAHLFTDGASRGNPGEAGAGIVLQAPTGEILKEEAVYLGIQTNNVAEYQALLLGLKLAKKLGIRKLLIFADSELLVRQIEGKYKVRNENLKNLFALAVESLENFEFSISHVRRHDNKKADALANEAIDLFHRKKKKTPN